jgi:hypothetical protein
MPSTRKTIAFLADLAAEVMVMAHLARKTPLTQRRRQLTDISNCATLRSGVDGITIQTANKKIIPDARPLIPEVLVSAGCHLSQRRMTS